jgi:hypothetical protein
MMRTFLQMDLMELLMKIWGILATPFRIFHWCRSLFVPLSPSNACFVLLLMSYLDNVL